VIQSGTFGKLLLDADTSSGEIPAGARFGRSLIWELPCSVWMAGSSDWM